MNNFNSISRFLKKSEKFTDRSNYGFLANTNQIRLILIRLIFLPLILSINVIINAQTVDFAMIGDFGDGSSSETAVATEINTWGVDFVVTAGDNRYGSIDFDEVVGKDYCSFLKDVVSGTNCSGGSATTNAFFPTTGNHDYTDGGGISEYLAYFDLPGTGVATSGTSGSELYYDVIQGIVHFFMIDSYDAIDNSASMTAQQNWLQTQLSASTATWKVVIFHHAPYSSCSTHGSTSAMQWDFAGWGADVVMSGHDHTYERLNLNGIPYFVNGLGGKSIYNFGTPVTGSQVRYDGDYGAMKISADATSMNFQFINTSGTVIDDYTLGAGSGSTGTVDVSISASGDDTEERLSDGLMDPISTDIELINDPADGDQLVGLLFRNIDIPQGATVTSAYLTFTADEVDTEATSVVISCEDADDAADFSTSASDLSGRTLTAASTSWNSIPNWNTIGETHQSPDISSAIQEVIDRGGWSANNKIAFIISGTGSRTAEAYDGVPASAPALYIEYSSSGAISMDISISSGDDDVEEEIGDGTMQITSTDLELVDDPGTYGDQTVGMLFRNINVPQGETISNAYITFTAKDATSASTSVTFHAEDEDNAAPFTSAAYNLTNRATTTASVDWNSIPAWPTAGGEHQSPDISSVIQEVVDRGGWNANNNIAIIVSGSGTRRAWSKDGNSGNTPPVLHIEYGAGAAPTTVSGNVTFRVNSGAGGCEETPGSDYGHPVLKMELYRDVNDNGILEDGGADGSPIATDITDINGNYSMTVSSDTANYFVKVADDNFTGLSVTLDPPIGPLVDTLDYIDQDFDFCGESPLCYTIADNIGNGYDDNFVVFNRINSAGLTVNAGITDPYDDSEALTFNLDGTKLISAHYDGSDLLMTEYDPDTGIPVTFNTISGSANYYDYSGGGSPTTGSVTLDDLDGLALRGDGSYWAAIVKSSDWDILIKINADGSLDQNAFATGVAGVALWTTDETEAETDHIDDLALDPTTLELYTLASDGSSGAQFIMQVDKTTGEMSTVSEITYLGSPLIDVEGLGFTQAGTFTYVSTGTDGPSNLDNSVFTVDISTGFATDPIDLEAFGTDYEGCDCLTRGTVSFRNGSIGNFVFEGTDPNTGTGIEDVVVVLSKSDGIGGYDVLETTTSDATGAYLFEGLPEGTYRVEIASSNFNAGQPLNGYSHAYEPDEGEPNDDGTIFQESDIVLTMTGGDVSSDLDSDFGVREPGYIEANPDTLITTVNVAGIVDVLDNDNTDLGDLDPSTVSIVPGKEPVNGSVSINSSTGEITYTPDIDFIGIDTFSYEVCNDQAVPSIINYPGTITTSAIGPASGTVTNNSVVITDGGTVTDLDVIVNLSHTYLGDIEMSLINSSQTVDIIFDECSGDDDLNKIFDDDGATWDCDDRLDGLATEPPEDPLVGFNGDVIADTWTLSITDDGNDDGGTLNSWSITITSTGSVICATTTVYIEVTGTDAENDINQTPVNIPTIGNVLTNDVDPQGDAQTVTEITYIGIDNLSYTVAVPTDGSDVTVTLGDGSSATAGTLAINEDGEYTFTPEPNYTGNVPNVEYEVTDVTGPTTVATLDIDVIPLDDTGTEEPPVANDDTNTTDQDVNVSGNVIDPNDSDPDTDQDDLVLTEITYTDVNDIIQTQAVPAGGNSGTISIYDEKGILAGTIIVSSDGSYTVDPAPSFTGKVPVGYKIIDDEDANGTPDGGSSEAILSITVISDPLGTINSTYANDDAVTGKKGETLTGNILTNDFDPEGDDQDVKNIMADTDGDGSMETVTPVAGTPEDVYQDMDIDGTPEKVGEIDVNPESGAFIWVPEPDFIGTAVMPYEATDGPATDRATLYITSLGDACSSVDVKVLLEGPWVSAKTMNTLLNDNHLLPGQDKDLSPNFAVIVKATHTPFGQPYDIAPWNYTGTAGTQFGDVSSPAATGSETPYDADAVDWVLVTVRENGILPADNVWRCTGWLKSGGSIEFPEECSCLDVLPLADYYIMIEHRNHLGILSPSAVNKVNGTLQWDFTTQDSYRPFVFRKGQKELVTGIWAMYAGNSQQDPGVEAINSSDQTVWKNVQNDINYLFGDLNMNVIANSADETIWKNNQNSTSGVTFY